MLRANKRTFKKKDFRPCSDVQECPAVHIVGEHLNAFVDSAAEPMNLQVIAVSNSQKTLNVAPCESHTDIMTQVVKIHGYLSRHPVSFEESVKHFRERVHDFLTQTIGDLSLSSTLVHCRGGRGRREYVQWGDAMRAEFRNLSFKKKVLRIEYVGGTSSK